MKEEVPSILISDGWETDANGALVEVAIPSTVDTYQNPTKVTFLGETLNWIPSAATELQAISCPNMTTMTVSFQGYSKLTEINFGSLSACQGEAFKNCKSLTTAVLSKYGSNNNYFFNSCTGLVSVQLGSPGNPVSAVGSNMFPNCTQSGLTITVYTNGGASLSGQPWGATNATIVYEEA